MKTILENFKDWILEYYENDTRIDVLFENHDVVDTYLKYGIDVSEMYPEYEVFICNHCKDFWINKSKCDTCGCSALTKTHESNAKFAVNSLD